MDKFSELVLGLSDSNAKTEAGKKRSVQYFTEGVEPKKYLSQYDKIPRYLRQLGNLEKHYTKSVYPAWVNNRIVESVYMNYKPHHPLKHERWQKFVARELYFDGKDAPHAFDYRAYVERNYVSVTRDGLTSVALHTDIERIVEHHLLQEFENVQRSNIAQIGFKYGSTPCAHYILFTDLENGRYFVDFPIPLIINCRKRKRIEGKMRKFIYNASKDSYTVRCNFLDHKLKDTVNEKPYVRFGPHHQRKLLFSSLNHHMWKFIDKVFYDRSQKCMAVTFKPYDLQCNKTDVERTFHTVVTTTCKSKHIRDDIFDAYKRRRRSYIREQKSSAIARVAKEKSQLIFVSYKDSVDSGNCHPGTREFFTRCVAPILGVDDIEKVGAVRADVLLESGEFETNSLLRNAITQAIIERYTGLLENA